MNSIKKVTTGILTTTFFLGGTLGIASEAKAQMSPQPAIDDEADIQVIYGNRIALNRAKNLARMAAEEANGGLDEYRAAAYMHGPAIYTPFVDNGDSWTFSFYGTLPDADIPAYWSVVTVSKDGERVNINMNEELL